MPDTIKDITPSHHPVSLLRNAIPIAENAVAGAVILMHEDGTMYWEHCGVTGRDLLWALESMKARVINDEVGD